MGNSELWKMFASYWLEVYSPWRELDSTSFLGFVKEKPEICEVSVDYTIHKKKLSTSVSIFSRLQIALHYIIQQNAI